MRATALNLEHKTLRKKPVCRQAGFNENKIAQHLEYIEKKLDEYDQALQMADDENKKIIEQQIEKKTTVKKNITS